MARLTHQIQISRCLQSQEEERLLLLTVQSTPGAQGDSVLWAEHVKGDKVLFSNSAFKKNQKKSQFESVNKEKDAGE